MLCPLPGLLLSFQAARPGYGTTAPPSSAQLSCRCLGKRTPLGAWDFYASSDVVPSAACPDAGIFNATELSADYPWTITGLSANIGLGEQHAAGAACSGGPAHGPATCQHSVEGSRLNPHGCPRQQLLLFSCYRGPPATPGSQAGAHPPARLLFPAGHVWAVGVSPAEYRNILLSAAVEHFSPADEA